MRGKNKLLQKINEEEIIRIVVNKTLKSKVDEVIVVTGYDEYRVKNTLEDLPIIYTKCNNYTCGMGKSISTGINSLSKNADGVIIILGDMPETKTENINILIDSFEKIENKSICILKSNGKQGNPVLFGKFFFDHLKSLSNDLGGKDIINNNLEYISTTTINDKSIFLDIDTPTELENFNKNK